jgi:hypothetical protein
MPSAADFWAWAPAAIASKAIPTSVVRFTLSPERGGIDGIRNEKKCPRDAWSRGPDAEEIS